MQPSLTGPHYPQRRPSHGSREMPPPSVPSHRTTSISSLTSPSIVHPSLPPNRSPTLSMASPRTSHGLLSPAVGLSHLPQEQQPFALKAPTITDIQEFSKESMQSAAERARVRRKLEEEEREKEKERARHKAAELAAAAEAKAAAKRAEEEAAARLKAEAEAAAESLIREEAEALAREKARAVESTMPSAPTQPSPFDQPTEHLVRRVRSSRGSKRGAEARAGPSSTPRVGHNHPVDLPGPRAPAISQSTAASLPRPSSWASVVKESDKTDVPQASIRKDLPTIGGDSWRSKAPKTAPHPAPPLGVTALPPLFDVTTEEHDALELFDFTDMHKLVGGTQDAKEPGPLEVTVQSLDEVVDITRESPDSTIRSQVSEASPRFHTTRPSMDRGRPSASHAAHSSSSHERGASHGTTSTRGPNLSSPATSTKGLMSPQALAALPLPPPKPHFRESSMSALEDALSRIKGALSNMRPGESSADLDEALAASSLALKAAHDETFAITQRPRPASPPPAHRRFNVRIRKEWPPKAQDPIDRRVLNLWKLPPRPVRWDILSWDPPVEGMSRKTLSRDEILFPPSSITVVSLPKSSASRSAPVSSLTSLSNSTPKVNLPAPQTGRRAVRRPENDGQASMLEIIESVSRSPPPASPARRASLSLPRSNHASQSRASTASPAPASPSSPSNSGRTKGPSRPTVDGVAFSRRLHGASDSVSSLVNFTVNSELEEVSDPVAAEKATSTRLPKINTDSPEEPQASEDVVRFHPFHLQGGR